MIRFIAIPVFKLIGLQNGISLKKASKIIGNHFPEVDDKLLNVLQLNESEDKSELFLASVEQKSAQLQPIPFKSAINFATNKRYLKYLAIPVLIWLFTFLTGNNSLFKESLTRVVNYQTAYEPPAPFSFHVLNDNLNAIEGKPFELLVETTGNLIPDNVQIHFNDENYFLKDTELGRFSHQFSSLNESLDFYLESNGVRSKQYSIQVVNTPTVSGFEMQLNYPAYTQKRDETVKNTGNAIVPEGTIVTWNINTQKTDSVQFIATNKESFDIKGEDLFTFSKQLRTNTNYQITASNKFLQDYEKLTYNIQITQDEFPKISVKSDTDSVSRGPIQFVGQLSDDYGIRRLKMVYYDADNKEERIEKPIQVSRSTFEEFYYVFDPLELELEKGKNYTIYFEVFDNDGVNGSKASKSELFNYYNKTNQEITDDLLKEQKESLDELDKASKQTEKLSKDFDELSKKLKNKKEIDWNDKKEFDQFLKRQKQYQEMFEKQTDKLQQNLDEQNDVENNESLKEQKEHLQKRIEETKEMQEKDKLLEELQKMAEKLDKEGMLDKLDKLTQHQKQEKRSLERLLEMTKRFYTEKKAAEIANKLDTLSKQQDRLSDSKENSSEEQKKLNEKFDAIQKDLEELRKQNKELRQPMDFPNTKQDERDVDQKMNDAEQELQEQEQQSPASDQNEEQPSNSPKQKQKSAAKKMKQMSQNMQQSMMQMQGEALNENIESLRGILENLVTFSKDQEGLMLSLDGVNSAHASFPKKLKKQQILKEHFEHIDDSLYTLSLRLQRLSAKIQEDITEAHYNIDKSLENIAESRMRAGITNQQYTMTAANNLADMLSDMLNSLQNPNMGQGQGEGESLPDIIKKQQGLTEKMKQGIQKKPGGEGQEEMTGEQYQIYQEQQALRKVMEELMNKTGKEGNKGKEALKKMKALEEQLLDKGFDNTVLRQMMQLEYELLKLDDASLKQGNDNKRESETNINNFKNRVIEQIDFKSLFFNPDEILNRQPLPLRGNYKKKVQRYFQENQ